MFEKLARALCFTALFTGCTLSAEAGVWVLQDAKKDLHGVGPCPSCCPNEPPATGSIEDGRASFTQEHMFHETGYCGDPGAPATVEFAWQSPPQRIAPSLPVRMNAAITVGDDDRYDRDNHPLGMLWLMLSPVDRPATLMKRVDALNTSGNADRPDTLKSASKALTFTAPDGSVSQDLYVAVNAIGGVQLSGSYLYHYVYHADEAGPASNVSGSNGPDIASTGSTNAGSDSPGPVAITTAIAAVLGGLLVSLGGLFTSGVAGIGTSGLISSLTDILKGKLPSDGFDEWKHKAVKVYGEGSPDDPFRDFEDINNPPWKSGQGATADNGATTSQTGLHTYIAEMHPVLASGDGAVIAPVNTDYVRHDEPIDVLYHAGPEGESIDDPVNRGAAPDPAPSSPEDHIDRYGEPNAANYQEFFDNGAKLDQTSKKLQAAVDQLKADGYYIANPTEPEWGPLHVPVELAVKLFNNVPHRAAEFADWLKCEATKTFDPSVWSDPDSPYYKSDPAEREELEKALHATIADPHFTQCGQAVELGRDKLTKSIEQIFGPDAVFTQISINSRTYDDWNHVANEVILPNGERYVVDVWASLGDGKPRIYREDRWIEKWKNDTWVGSGGSTVTRGSPGHEFEGQLETDIQNHGLDEGAKHLIDYTAKHAPNNVNAVQTVVTSYRNYPWQIGPDPAPPPPPPPKPSIPGKFKM